MKMAISANGPELDAEVDPRFGRCQYFIIADPETMEFEAMDNSSSMSAGGAGISAGQVIAAKGVQAVLTGNCGPNAHQVLSAAGIQIVTGVSGKVRDAIEGYKLGKYKASAEANVPDHFGMGGGMGIGRGLGGGMGMRSGMTPPTGLASPPADLEQELQALKTQSQEMAQQLADIQRRIDKLDKTRE